MDTQKTASGSLFFSGDGSSSSAAKSSIDSSSRSSSPEKDEEKGTQEGTTATGKSKQLKESSKTTNLPTRSARPRRVASMCVGFVLLVAATIAVATILNRRGFEWPLGMEDNQSASDADTNFVTLSQLAERNVSEDCWIAYSGVVYDMTAYQFEHPGGSGFINAHCGADGTEAYGRYHSQRLLKTISNLQIGALSLDEATPSAMPSARTDAPTLTPSAAPTKMLTTSAPTEFGFTPPPTVLTQSPTSSPTATKCFVSSYNLEEVQRHDTRNDCWYVLYGRVWDLTSYVDRHPGNARNIFLYCGTDATAIYEGIKKHNTQLLAREVPELEIGLLGSETGEIEVPCQ